MLGGRQLHHPGTFTASFQLKNEHCSLPTFTGLPLTSASGRPAGGGGAENHAWALGLSPSGGPSKPEGSPMAARHPMAVSALGRPEVSLAVGCACGKAQGSRAAEARATFSAVTEATPGLSSLLSTPLAGSRGHHRQRLLQLGGNVKLHLRPGAACGSR